MALMDPWASLVCSFLGLSARHHGHSQEFSPGERQALVHALETPREAVTHVGHRGEEAWGKCMNHGATQGWEGRAPAADRREHAGRNGNG